MLRYLPFTIFVVKDVYVSMYVFIYGFYISSCFALLSLASSFGFALEG